MADTTNVGGYGGLATTHGQRSFAGKEAAADTSVCDLLIEPNDILANFELVLSAADTTKGGHGAGGYVTNPDCYVRKY